MIKLEIPGQKTIQLSHIVLDYNGTLAKDGKVLPGIKKRLEVLAQNLQVHVLTADTYGSVGKALSKLPCKLFIIPKEKQAEAKAAYVVKLGKNKCAAIGNGKNDSIMLKKAALGIGVIQAECAFSKTIQAADIVSLNILDALDLLRYPLRLKATMRT